MNPKFTNTILSIFLAGIISLLLGLHGSKNLSLFRTSNLDSESYLLMAQGEPDSEKLILHHARRLLYPTLVRQIHRFFDIHTSFLIAGSLSAFIFLSFLLVILTVQLSISWPAALLIACQPYLIIIFSELYLPTLFFMALASVFWFFMLRGFFLASLSVLFLLLLTREESLILAAAWAAVFLIKRTKSLKEMGYFSVLIGLTGLSQWLVKLKTIGSNMHEMDPYIFSILRIPFFIFWNFLGILGWTNTFPIAHPDARPPIWSMTAPAWLQQVSNIREVGIYDWLPHAVLMSACLLVLCFGVAPGIYAFCVARRKFAPEENFSWHVLVLASLLNFSAAFVIGPPTLRYPILAWPLFMLAVPVMLEQLYADKKSQALPVLALNFFCAWLLMPAFASKQVVIQAAALLLGMFSYWITYTRIKPNIISLGHSAQQRKL